MATLLEVNSSLGASNSKFSSSEQDPFISQVSSSNHHRFANFDNNLFTLSPTTSPDQAKRALEAHLAETERRIQDASRLGTSLLQQRKDLEGRLEEIEKLQDEENITPELRQKLQDIEKDYYEVGRESARAFLSKPRTLNNEIVGLSGVINFVDKRSISPFKERLECQGTGSPSKLNVTNRRQRNQPMNRVHDIEFATEISTSLLSQVRSLQALLAQKEEDLKAVVSEKSILEVEVESYTDRLRSLDESGERYKDENWNLETQIQEYRTKEKEAADRERRLTQNFNIIQVEKSTAQKELDEIKSAFAKLLEEHNLALKHSDAELGNMKRNLVEAETERSSLQQKVEELLSQNMELVKAIAHQRGRLENIHENYGLAIEDIEIATEDLTPEHSPPPSPVKGTPRHSHLESETLKSSLHHAHRMIQNLKSNIYREKTEKLELKRLLQDARDELEQRRGEIGQSGGKKARKLERKESSKRKIKIDKLGGLRNSTNELYLDESNWEDDHHDEQNDSGPTFGTSSAALAEKSIVTSHGPAWSTSTTPAGTSDHFETANEQEVSDAFETADESTVQEDDLRVSQEGLSEDLTETEGDFAWRIPNRTASGNRFSFQSTASTSDDDYHNGQEKFRILNNAQPSRLRLKVHRGGSRSSRVASEEPHFHGSPASFANSSRDGTPQAIGQSLFAELGDIVGSGEEEEFIDEIPHSFKKRPRSMRSNSSLRATRSRHVSPLVVSKPIMADFGVMTEPWEPELLIYKMPVLDIYEYKTNNMILAKDDHSHISVAIQVDSLISMTDASSQSSENHILEGLIDERPRSFNNTPRSVQSNSSLGATRSRHVPPLVASKPIMADFGVMTEPWEPELPINKLPILEKYRSEPGGTILAEDDTKLCPKYSSVATQIGSLINMKDASSQWYEKNISEKDEIEFRSNRSHTYSDMSSQCDLNLKDDRLAHLPELSTSREGRGYPPISPVHGVKSKLSSRPLTPNVRVPLSPSINDSPTPRPYQSYGATSIKTPTRNNMQSRVSSMSSFASEIETRFQMHNRLGVSTDMQSGIQSSTDPRMISAITQTMIGEYLWKYTRKTGRGVMSEKRHRRYFWVHPYTRTLYWSDRDPSVAGRAELKAKSVPIEAVRVVTDDNPMPPGLHRKSLIIMTPNRVVKFTATTGQRHETWFNSLSYLLLRTEEKSLEDTSINTNESITSEDVAEFNPSCKNTLRAGTTSQQAENHYTSRIESHAKNSNVIGSRSSRISIGKFSRLSNYWRPSREGLIGSMSSRQSKYSIDNIKSVYEASEVHDSAEDLREIIEKQDRESDKLENVRACCDGRHDVGHLHNSSRSRYTKTISTIQGSSRAESGVKYDTRNKCDKHLSNF